MERRFGIKWESPAPKLKEVVQALRAVWQSWQAGTRLDFQGRFFKLDLMTPFFTPPPLPNPRIPIYVAGVNRGMFRVAGEVADGLHLHPLHTVRYLREVMAPAILSGLTKSGRSRHDVWIACPVFTAVGATEAEIQKRKEECRKNIAFYASTRTYRRVLELHGWGDVCDRLHAKTLRGDWKSLAGEVDDDILKEFVIEGAWDDIATRLRGRYSGIVDAVRLYVPFDGSRKWESLVSRFRS
jgi:probable F420-dependent oxidoreductase